MAMPPKQPQTGDVRRFIYRKPEPGSPVRLARSTVLGFGALNGAAIEVSGDDAAESAYLMLGGRMLLMSGDSVMAELGPMDGVYVPRGAECRIEPTTDQAELLHIAALDPRPSALRGPTRQAMVRTFRYESPDLGEETIKVPYLVEQKDMLGLPVEKVRDGGGDDGFHTHSGTDSVWYVLAGGRARFRLPDGSELVVGQGEGVFIPRMAAYGFAALDHEPSEVLHVKVRDLSVPNERIDY